MSSSAFEVPEKKMRSEGPNALLVSKLDLGVIQPHLLGKILNKCLVKSFCRMRKTCKFVDKFVTENLETINIPVEIDLKTGDLASKTVRIIYEPSGKILFMDQNVFLKYHGYTHKLDINLKALNNSGFVISRLVVTSIVEQEEVLENLTNKIVAYATKYQKRGITLVWKDENSTDASKFHPFPLAIRLIRDLPNVSLIRGPMFWKDMKTWYNRYQSDNDRLKAAKDGFPCWKIVEKLSRVEILLSDTDDRRTSTDLFRTLINEWKCGAINLNHHDITIFDGCIVTEKRHWVSKKLGLRHNGMFAKRRECHRFPGDWLCRTRLCNCVLHLPNMYNQLSEKENLNNFTNKSIMKAFEVVNDAGQTGIVTVSGGEVCGVVLHFLSNMADFGRIYKQDSGDYYIGDMGDNHEGLP